MKLEEEELKREKTALRKTMKEQLEARASDLRPKAGEAAAALLRSWSEWPNRRLFFSYLSLPSEFDTSRLNDAALSAGKLLGLPRITGETIEFHQVASPASVLSTNRLGIREPGSALPLIDAASGRDLVVIVPGIAFTLAGRRLGRGGGFYDRFLSTVPNALKIGLCFELQIVSRVPVGPADIEVDWLLTESKLIAARPANDE